MATWQVDFYRRPLQDEAGNPLWELVVCDASRSFSARAFCPQAQATAAWLTAQLQSLIGSAGQPDCIQVFRPQALSLLQAACLPLKIPVEATRRTPALKQLLQTLAAEYPTLPHYTGQPYEPIALDQPPPLPLPENLWGDQWRFGAIAAQDLIAAFEHRPIPIRDMPESLYPMALGIASTTMIPGVIIDGGRRSMLLARWLQQAKPFALNYIPGDPDGLILQAALVDRWVLTTFEDPDVIAAARSFRERQQSAAGLHFLLVQPDDSGMTYTGLWLLQNASSNS
ncbi:Tab2/Atab2 family RNA-binding protein [Phormidium tenue FACHB-886]|nr:Tab2/Atab2 family RNA-binding protein [Phormidium tenue FACHB-886]